MSSIPKKALISVYYKDGVENLANELSLDGWAIISTSLILIMGYAVLTLAQVKSIIYFGFLSQIVIVSALFADLFILSSLILTFRKKRQVP